VPNQCRLKQALGSARARLSAECSWLDCKSAGKRSDFSRNMTQVTPVVTGPRGVPELLPLPAQDQRQIPVFLLERDHGFG
jgi:hypothetical protein